MVEAALGFRVHTGWAAAVALVGSAVAPRVVERRRVALSTVSDVVELQVFHAAAEQPIEQAEPMIARVRRETNTTTAAGIAALVEALGGGGHRVVRAGIVGGNMRLPRELAKILASHALIHAAEGAMFREAIIAGCTSCKIAVVEVPGHALYERAGEVLARTAGGVRERVAGLGAGLGPPWGKDQKEAALVAWLALAG